MGHGGGERTQAPETWGRCCLAGTPPAGVVIVVVVAVPIGRGGRGAGTGTGAGTVTDSCFRTVLLFLSFVFVAFACAR